MKYTFKTITLTLALCASTFAFMPTRASAENVFCYSEGSLSHYLSSEKVSFHEGKDCPYRALVKVFRTDDGMYMNFFTFGFSIEDNNVVGYVFNRSKGQWEYVGKASDEEKIDAIWQTMKPYMDEKGIYYDDAWQ